VYNSLAPRDEWKEIANRFMLFLFDHWQAFGHQYPELHTKMGPRKLEMIYSPMFPQ
jgi:hypothetical protein